MKQTVRIIGGVYRGKKLHFPAIQGLRPTPDRIRETLFNWLMHDIRGSRCLDAFAGSGALGFEAFSRGASQVVLLEKSPVAFTSLKQAALSFNTPHITAINTSALDYLVTNKEPYDVIFLDPPFASNYLEQCLSILTTGNCLIPQGLLYVESAEEITLPTEQWTLRKTKKAGQVFYALYEKC